MELIVELLLTVKVDFRHKEIPKFSLQKTLQII